MTVLPLVVAPDIRFSEIAEPVAVIDDALRKIIDDMFDTMYANKCAGLAATQVGINKRIAVIGLPKTMDDAMPKFAAINPEILYSSEETWAAVEGSPSFPIDERFEITRPKHIKLKYLDYHGAEQMIEASDWLARALQHEIDHLNGITIVHYLSKIKRDMILRKLAKYKKNLQK